MILVKAYFTTEADGTRVGHTLDVEDLPQAFYGPFDDISAALSFIENDYPEGDDDLYDLTADDYEVPPGTVINDPVEWLKQFEEEDLRDE